MDCAVCGTPAGGDVRFAGVAARRIGAADDPARRRWVWGPVPVHGGCRPRLTTPYDDQLGVPEAAVCGAEYYVAAALGPGDQRRCGAEAPTDRRGGA